MSRQRRNLPPSPAPEPDPVATRRRFLGQVAAVTWYLGGFVLLLVCAATQTGPYAWAAAWQHRHRGGDTVLLSFLPGFLALLAPLVVVARMPRRADRPFLLGLQDAVWLTGRPARPSVPVGTRTERLRRVGRGMAVLAVAAALGGGSACWWSLQPGAQAPGTELPEITLAALPEIPLPGYARITGAVARPDQAWVHDYAIRTTSYHDVFVPLTAPNWQDGDPVTVLALDIRADPGKPGPLEGIPERGRLPAWQIAAMREGGLQVSDDPVVLRRLALDGRVPAPDGVDAVAFGVLGTALALSFGGIAWSCRLAIRRIQGATPRG